MKVRHQSFGSSGDDAIRTLAAAGVISNVLCARTWSVRMCKHPVPLLSHHDRTTAHADRQRHHARKTGRIALYAHIDGLYNAEIELRRQQVNTRIFHTTVSPCN